jgi:general secretion pathway protein G
MAQKPVSRGFWLGLGFALGLAVGVALTMGVMMVLSLAAGHANSVAQQLEAAGQEANTSHVITRLLTVRSQLLLYKAQHNDAYPSDLVAQMTQFTDAVGHTSPVKTEQFCYGPYLPAGVPENPFTQSTDIDTVKDGYAVLEPPDKDAGWWYNTVTGEFRANLTDQHRTADGQRLNRM